MVLLQSGFADGAKIISHPIALVAYVCALLAYYFISVKERKKLKVSAEVYQATAERLNNDFKQSPADESANVTKRVFRNRILIRHITTISLVMGWLIVVYISFGYVSKQRETQPYELDVAKRDQEDPERPAKTRVINRLNSIKTTAGIDSSSAAIRSQPAPSSQSGEVKLLIKRGKSIIAGIRSGNDDSWNIDANFYDVKVIDFVANNGRRSGNQKFNVQLIERMMHENSMLGNTPSGNERIKFDSLRTLQAMKHRVRLLEEIQATLP